MARMSDLPSTLTAYSPECPKPAMARLSDRAYGEGLALDCEGSSGRLGSDVNHPGDPKFVIQHAEVVAPWRWLERHRDRAAGR